MLLLQCCMCYVPRSAAVHIAVSVAHLHEWQVQQTAFGSASLTGTCLRTNLKLTNVALLSAAQLRMLH